MESFKRTLLPFQGDGKEFFRGNYHGLLADDMGTGKTTQALAAWHSIGGPRAAVVCPASVRENWKREIVECCGPSALSRFHIDSYNAAADGKFPAGAYDAIILDEAHYLKTTDSQRTQAIFGNADAALNKPGGLARSAKIKWALTGTPVLNRPRELYPILATLAAHRIAPHSSFNAFAQRFCGAYFDGRGINTKGATHLDDLRMRLQGFMLRRTKAEVLPQLPPRVVQRFALDSVTEEDLAPVRALEAEIENRETYLSSVYEEYSQLGDTARLDKALGIAKARAVAEFVDDLIETTDRKVVVVTRHREVVRLLDQYLGHQMPECYQGGMTDEQKAKAIRTFQTDKDCCVIIGNMQAIGTGVDGLQKASCDIVFAEFSWCPKEMEQCMDRLHRLGQSAAAVNVYIPYIEGTLEGVKLQVNWNKSVVIRNLFGGALFGEGSASVVQAPTEADMDLILGGLL